MVGTVFQLDGAPLRFFCCVHAFFDRELPDGWIGRGGPFPAPLQNGSSGCSLLEVFRDIVYFEKV
jgi:hypothetical protein